MKLMTKEQIIEKVKATGAFTFQKGSAIISVSGDHDDNMIDYYGDYRGGYSWINPILEKVAKDCNCYWEWDNPSSISLWRI